MQRRAAEESLTDHGKDNSNGRAHVGDAIRHKPGILGFLRQIGFMGATGDGKPMDSPTRRALSTRSSQPRSAPNRLWVSTLTDAKSVPIWPRQINRQFNPESEFAAVNPTNFSVDCVCPHKSPSFRADGHSRERPRRSQPQTHETHNAEPQRFAAARAFLTHLFGPGLDDDRYVIVQCRRRGPRGRVIEDCKASREIVSLSAPDEARRDHHLRQLHHWRSAGNMLFGVICCGDVARSSSNRCNIISRTYKE